MEQGNKTGIVVKTVDSLVLGDSFRYRGSDSWRRVVAIHVPEYESNSLDRPRISCLTEIEDSSGTFRFDAFGDAEVEALNG